MGLIEEGKAQQRLTPGSLRPNTPVDQVTANQRYAEPSARWHKAGIDTADPDGDYASQRLRHPRFTPMVTGDFRISRDDHIYAMGSCFAREVERLLVRRGFQVDSRAAEFREFVVVDSRVEVDAWAFTDKYNTFSILNEVRWALDPDATFAESSLVDLSPEVCIDPHILQVLAPVDHAAALERRRIITDVTRRITGCRILLLTLGLVEVWYDTHAGVFLNTTPTREVRIRHPGRYQVFTTDYLQNMENLEHLHQLLTAHGHPDMRIVVTTSPVPQMATVTAQDVVVANTYTKSTLRVVAQDWATRHDNVQYFPGYEIVMNSDRRITWQDDLRHVTTEIVDHVIDCFEKAFVSTETSPASTDREAL
jgi:hypothetical protein